MAVIVTIKKEQQSWRQSPLIKRLMELDKQRYEKAVKQYRKKQFYKIAK